MSLSSDSATICTLLTPKRASRSNSVILSKNIDSIDDEFDAPFEFIAEEKRTRSKAPNSAEKAKLACFRLISKQSNDTIMEPPMSDDSCEDKALKQESTSTTTRGLLFASDDEETIEETDVNENYNACEEERSSEEDEALHKIAQEAPFCKCGVISVARTSQAGKMYYACGGRRKQARVKKSPYAKTQRCDFFEFVHDLGHQRRKRNVREHFACQQALLQDQTPQENLNKHLTDQFQWLHEFYKSRGDEWRANSYKKVATTLSKLKFRVKRANDVKNVRGFGKSTLDKITEFLESGHLRKIEACDEEKRIITLFTNVWGAGPTTAYKWYNQYHCRSLQDVVNKCSDTLTHAQKCGILYYDDLLERMPREEVARIEAVVNEAVKVVLPDAITLTCGSYRRGKPTCGDVDILITHKDGSSHEGVIGEILKIMRASHFITADLSSSSHKYMGIVKLNEEGAKNRRLDIIAIPYNEFACASLYFTGSDYFNRSMRHWAKNTGMTLTEKCVAKAIRVRGEKVHTYRPIATRTEEDVFNVLKLDYVPPNKRDPV